MTARAFSMVAAVSKERSASTSVETRPGTILVSSVPKLTARRSQTAWTAFSLPPCFLPQPIASSTIWA